LEESVSGRRTTQEIERSRKEENLGPLVSKERKAFRTGGREATTLEKKARGGENTVIVTASSCGKRNKEEEERSPLVDKSYLHRERRQFLGKEWVWMGEKSAQGSNISGDER